MQFSQKDFRFAIPSCRIFLVALAPNHDFAIDRIDVTDDAVSLQTVCGNEGRAGVAKKSITVSPS